jgi:hypothetical protein
LFALGALIFSAITIRRGPWWAGLTAGLLALAVGATSFVTF